MAEIDNILTQDEQETVIGKEYQLPNGLCIQQLNTYETNFIYNEIFERKIYMKHGISLRDGDCVFDLGANIGLFSLFILTTFKKSLVYAVEPCLELCHLIRSNTASYHDRIKVIQCGIAAENKEALFSFYPGYSILSGFNPDPEADFHSLRAGLDTGKPDQSEVEKKCLDYLAKEKLEERKDYVCKLRTISSLIEEYQIQTINLLKIDIERSELEALRGIAAEDWAKIQQIVMEVHDPQGTVLNEIMRLLQEKGFMVETETEACLKGTGIVNLYALRQRQTSHAGLASGSDTEPDRVEFELTSENENGQIAIAATFTTQPLLPSLQFWRQELAWPFRIQFAQYNQVFQELLLPGSTFTTNANGMNALLIKWDDWLRYFNKEKTAKGNQEKSPTVTKKQKEHLKEAFSEFLKALHSYAAHSPCHTLLLICPPAPTYGKSRTFRQFFRSFEEKLVTQLKELNSIELLKAEAFHSQYQVTTIFDSVSDAVGHVPYAQEYYNFLATLIIRRYYSLKNNSYKAIIVDCDHTLWDGVCGETGPEGVKVEGIYAAFQRYLAIKAEAGYLLCLCSKNNEADVWRVFQEHQGMILKKEQLVDSRLNWLPKSENIQSLAAAMNLGSDSFVFIDDNPVECAEVRANCPEVFTMEWPKAAADANFLDHLWMLDHFQVTAEDRLRRDSYRANVEREKLLAGSYDFESFLQNLQLDVVMQPLTGPTLPRAAQLSARTNQFNFTGTRRTVAELRNLLTEPAFEGWTVKVSDRFGDYGVVGLFILKKAANLLEIDTFLLSCRVLGRGVEHQMMRQIGTIARQHGLASVKIIYQKTGRNEPARLFLEQFIPEFTSLNQEQQPVELVISLEQVNACTFRPPQQKTSLTKPNVNGHREQLHNPQYYELIRKRERLLFRIATQLKNVRDLTRAIADFNQQKTSITTIVTPPETKSAAIATKDQIHDDQFYPVVLAAVKEAFTQELQVTEDVLVEDREFSEYFQHDSLKIVTITSILSKEFPNLPPTILFEQRNLGDVARSIIATHRDILKSKYAKKQQGLVDEHRDSVTVASRPIPAGSDDDAIAIIGINGKFPKAATINEFWHNLREGLSCIEKVPADRWDEAAFFETEGKPGKTYCKWGGFLSEIYRFEASFFHISPREAETMDPQQRLFLEIVWGLLEDAGYTPRTISRNTGVYVGVIAGDYGIYTNEAAVAGAGSYRNTDYYQIPNRISYFFNFHGPSIAIDTACSGGGTALHLACQAIKQGECDTAIVGGVNLFLHPGRFIQYAQMQVLSKDDKCRPFGANATGTIYGEGVSAVLLKPLVAAKKDGDYIYGVIKASAVNTGGKTNGFTVPNPLAQAELISKALREAKIAAETISYVETHGTGTPLGDPIEIRGLTQAFQENQSTGSEKVKNQYCAIGSVKSNIGHLESGAALAGLIKILLQMKHKMLVPSLNSEQTNPMIRFEATPFRLQHQLEPWHRLEGTVDGKPVVFPRRAGLSSFGAGGVNTHFIIEEYQQETVADLPTKGPQLILLSARSQERLLTYAAKMGQSLREALAERESGLNLVNIAYTLQTGREAMPVRLAIIASDLQELIMKLEAFCQGQTDGESIFSGDCHGKQAMDRDLAQQFSATDTPNSAQLKRQAQQWVSGGTINWELLYEEVKPQRIPLPTYPFSGQCYQIGEPQKFLEKFLKTETDSKLHPLIDSNQSDFYEQTFVKNLSEADLFMKDHVVNGQLILPGVAYFEMVRCAATLSNRHRKVRRIRKMVWSRPLILNDQSQQVFLKLRPRQNLVACTVWTLDEAGEELVHGECNLEYEHTADQDRWEEDLAAITASCPQTLTGVECYQIMGSIGYQYGPSFQVIKSLAYNQKLAVSRLELQEKADQRIALYPSLLDGALQTITCWISQVRQKPHCPYVPFTVAEVEIFQPLTPVCYAVVSEVAVAHPGTARIEKYDVKLVDPTGQLLVHIKEYYPRPFQKPALPIAEPKVAKELFYKWQWTAAPISGKANLEADTGYLLFDSDEHLYRDLLELNSKISASAPSIALVKPGESYRELENFIYEINPGKEGDYHLLIQSLHRQGFKPGKVIHLWSQMEEGFGVETLGVHLDLGLFSIQFLCKALLKERIKNHVDLIYIFSSQQADQPEYAAIGGMANSIHCENPKLRLKIIDLPRAETTLECILQETQMNENPVMEIKYRDRQRFSKTFTEFDFETATQTSGGPIIRNQGVYLITGGLGGLGLIFAQYLAKFQTRLVLTGRSAITSVKAAKLKELEAAGAQVTYIQSDLSRREEVDQLIATIKSEFGTINGIIHSAGLVKDSLLINKSREETAEVIASKVWGSVFLDRATCREKLDFFVMFSSTTAIIGHIGQAGYAYANRFLNEYVLVRENLRRMGRCFGKTMVINWPWWQEGGMRLDRNTEKLLERAYGLQGLATEKGLQVFERSLNSSLIEFALIVGDPDKVARLFKPQSEQEQPMVSAELSIDPELTANPELKQRLIHDLRLLIQEILKLPPEEMAIDQNFSEFGFDSISFTQFSNRINECYDINISPASFYEYQTLAAFSEFLFQENPDLLKSYYLKKDNSLNIPATAGDESDRADVVSTTANLPDRYLLKPSFNVVSDHLSEDLAANEPVAIVGMGGIFPQSADLESFWQHLVQGDCLITEVSKERWNWEEFYGDPQIPNKTDVKWGGFIAEVDRFDPLFFGISPREASLMDPQQRLFLETVYHAIEDAGYPPSALSGTATGLFVGASINDYNELMKDYGIPIDPLISSGINNSMIANRISFLLNIHGPSEVIDTACSSSLVAISHAVDSIRSGRCEMAIAGGVNVILRPKFHISFRKAGMLSPDGRCKTFDATADGYVRGEGAGAIVLKPLHKAITDRDHIYAVIKGVAVNHGGRAQSLTAPNPKAQAELLVNAYRQAQIPIETVSYIEAHGTGTSLGDPIEINGLKEAFMRLVQDKGQVKKDFCGLGSVKTNIGHLECASGIASVIKVLLALKYKQLPASINFRNLNPYIDLTGTPFYIVSQTKPWESVTTADQGEIPRRAGVSSFGFGGTNAHIVLEEYPSSRNKTKDAGDEPVLIVLSARNEERLRVVAQKLQVFLERQLYNNQPDSTFTMTDLAYTLQVGREAMEERLAIIAFDIKELQKQLNSFLRGEADLNQIYRGNVKNNRCNPKLLFEGEEGQEFIRNIIAKRQLDKLAQLWVAGFSFDWSLLYHNQSYHRISLPTYPFARERHWIIPEQQRSTNAAKELTVPSESPKVMYFQPTWEKADPVESFVTDNVRWILFFGNGAAIKRTIETVQQELDDQLKVILVRNGEQFQPTGELEYTINPLCPEDYLKLLIALQERQINLERIINLWPVEVQAATDNFENNNLPAALIRHLQIFGLSVGFHLIRAVHEVLDNQKLIINIVYSSQGQNANPFFESMAGLARSLKMITPAIFLSTLEINGNNQDEASLAKIIARELRSAEFISEVRYWDQTRYIQKIRPLVMDNSSNPALLKQQGVYLITGGTGGLGSLFASFLAEQYQARLILLGRSPLDRQRQKLVDTLKSYGSDCLYLQADVTDPVAMGQVIEEISNRFGTLNGVIHAAGSVDQCNLLQKSWAEFESILQAKMQGTLILDELTKELSLDFFVTFSSLASILGDFGQCDYAVANRFLDSFVAFREKLRGQKLRQGRTIAIAWPLWKAGGMHFDPDGEAFYLKSSGMSYLESNEGWEAFVKILNSNQSHVIVISGQPTKVNQFLLNENQPSTVKSVLSSAEAENQDSPMPVPTAPDNIWNQLLTEVRGIIASITEIDPERLDFEENLGCFGLDSITLKEFSAKLNTTFGVTVLPSLFFSHSSIKRVCRYLLEQYGKAIEAYYTKHNQSLEPVTAIGCNENKEPMITSPPVSLAQVPQNKVLRPKEPVAVIGMAGIFPGSRNLEEFWNHLEAQHDLVTEIPSSRWDWQLYYSTDKSEKNKTVSKWGAFISDVDKFDAEFFNISPLEAELIDPQQRLYIQTVWKAIEDSGYKASQLAGKQISVFTGIQFNDYQRILENNGIINSHSGTGNAHALISNRISYLFNFKGPSEAIDTACSGSLVAVHRGVRSIQNGESEIAIAGGISLILTPHNHIAASQLGILSPDGRCKTFDQSANGYVKGEGIGVIILKPLSRAIADHDSIYAVIKGTAVNHGGKAHSLTAPNSEAQADLLVAAYEEAEIPPGTVSYIEAHGTGTELGDPVEIEGLNKAFQKLAAKMGTPLKSFNYCGLGALKTNIGHLEPAAGIAGLIKVILALKYKKLPGIVHFNQLNPYIQLERTPFYIITKTQPWEQLLDEYGHKLPRRAGVSAFGFGGTNAHVVVEEYEAGLPVVKEQASDKKKVIILLSAKKKPVLQTYAKEMAEYIQKLCLQPLPSQDEKKVQFQVRKSDLISLVSDVVNIAANNCTGDDLSEYGLDRISAAELTQKINEKYQLTETAETILACGSITALTDYLSTKVKKLGTNSFNGTDFQKEVKVIQPGYSLEDIAYTLQVGREEMEERLAFVATSIEETVAKLLNFSQGDVQNIFTGNIGKTKNNLNALDHGKEEQDYLYSLVKNGKLNQVAQLWVCGMKINWEELFYPGTFPRRISLPTYPFSGASYWVSETPDNKSEITRTSIHPLIDRIDFSYSFNHNGFAFAKTLTANDPIVKDHQVGGRLIFPAVGYLEMAYAAAVQLCSNQPVVLSNIVWLRPLEIQQPQQIRLLVTKIENRFHFEIRSGARGNDSVLHCQGDFTTGSGGNRSRQQIEIDPIKMRAARHLSQATIYEKYSAIGLEYGKLFRSLEKVWGNDRESLGRLYLPKGVATDFTSYLLHPALTDGALQTAIGITLWSDLSRALIPFAVAQVEILQPLPRSGYAYVQFAGKNKFNVALLDDSGQVCLKIMGVTVKAVKNQLTEFCYRPLWQTAPSVKRTANLIPVIPKPSKIFIFYNSNGLELKNILVKYHQDVPVITIDLGKDNLRSFLSDLEEQSLIYFLGGIDTSQGQADPVANLAVSQELGVFSFFRLIKLLSAAGYDQKQLIFKVITNNVYSVLGNESLKPQAATIHGMIKSMSGEYPYWQISTIDLDLSDWQAGNGSENWKALVECIANEPANPKGDVVAFRNCQRYLRVLYPVKLPATQRPVFRHRGVYLILGGAGGIGLELALYLAKEAQARLILIGRSLLSHEQNEKIKRIEAAGGEVLYIQADATDLEAMRQAITQGKKRYGAIHGAIHSALVLKDKTIRNMDEASFRAAMAPKVEGSVILHKVLSDENLDFMAFFSSAQSFAGNPGQSNYTAGCAFEDAFAYYLQTKLSYPVTVFNWGYWGTVGVAANQEYQKRFAAQGVRAIYPDEGLETFKRAIAQGIKQVVPVKASRQLLEAIGVAFLAENLPPSGASINVTKEKLPEPKKPKSIDNPKSVSAKDLNEPAVEFLKDIFAKTLKIEPENIDGEATFEMYGVDSVFTIEITNKLEKIFGKLPATLLYENMTIAKLSQYFVTNHLQRLQQVLHFQIGPETIADPETLFSNISAAAGSFENFDEPLPCDSHQDLLTLPEPPGEDLMKIDRLSDAEVDLLLKNLLENHDLG